MILIDRPVYMKAIAGFIDSDFVKVIIGIRRSGKSELLNLIRQNIKNRVEDDHIIHINFEKSEFFDIRDYKDLTKFVEGKMTDKGKYYLFLDEPQEVIGWEKAVNSLRLMNTDIYITGSNSKLLDGDFATLLGGRIKTFTMYPLSFNEFLEFKKQYEKPSYNLEQEIDDYIKYGGFPAVAVRTFTIEEARGIVTDIHHSALFKDVVARYNIKNPQLLDKIVAFIYDNVGNPTSIKSINDYLKSQGRKATGTETIANYLQYLESAFIIKKAERYDIKGKKLLETNDKYYLTDHSLQYVVRDVRGNKVQAVLENIVYIELIRRGYKVYVGKFDAREIDFVAEKNGDKLYVQVCLEFTTESTYAREFTPLKEIKDNYPKYVVSMDKYADRNDNGVIGIALKEFLLKDSF